MLPEEKAFILTRLQSAEGHLDSVICMVEIDQNCIEVLHKLQAVQAALQDCEKLILCHQLQQSLEIACYNKCPEKRTTEMRHLVDLYRFYLMFI
jgi:DNA-binding FrmR family transcriptional regulator